ncbi:hypothetical protein OE88DRAFT_1749602 [Heliocybe sulcata]|uniref:Uncharacterized protein n=1 Tax=Heliocybe sulcata TaxID=5364 RepID=A0A5C3MZG7_9AGAM|nr:hypothetical protein OE88DRAFT_1749602 [Heliocybe sulcata]
MLANCTLNTTIPVIHPLPIPTQVFETTTDNICYDIRNCRTTLNILWSCLATIFACTWVAIHPNIPPRGEHWFRRLGRQVITTIIAIIAPELIVCWAAKQYFASKRLAQRFKAYGFTHTHGFFVTMGGFVLYDRAEPVQRLTQELMRSENHILVMKYNFWSRPSPTCPIPRVTEEEIKNMSKGDWFSKCLALFQTTWFIMQCIGRGVQKLPLTELELATCAFAVLNVVTYGLWWNKPKSVDCPVAIRRHIPSSNTPTSRTWGRNSFKDLVGWFKSTKNTFSDVQLLAKHIWGNAGMLLYNNNWLLVPLLPLSPFVQVLVGGETPEGQQSVGTYYSGDLGNKDLLAVQVILVACSTIFGAIHCMAWSFEFESHLVQILWRSCSLVIAVFPITEFGLWMVVRDPNFSIWFTYSDTCRGYLGRLLMVICLLVYITARITLLVLAFMQLASLPLGAYQTVSWTNFIPHI